MSDQALTAIVATTSLRECWRSWFISAGLQPSSAFLHQRPVHCPVWHPVQHSSSSASAERPGACQGCGLGSILLREWIGEQGWEPWGDVLGRGHAEGLCFLSTAPSPTHGLPTQGRGKLCTKAQVNRSPQELFSFLSRSFEWKYILRNTAFGWIFQSGMTNFVSAQSVLFELRFWENSFFLITQIKGIHQLQKNFSWGIYQKLQNIIF